MAIDKLTTTSFLDESVTNLKIAVSARASTVMASASVGDLSDVDITTSAPTNNQTLIWDNANSKFIPGTSFSQGDFDTALTASDTDDLSEGTTNLYYTDARADARVALVIDSAPSTLNTLNELASALGDDANFSTTITNQIAAKLPLSGGTMTGDIDGGGNKVLFANVYSATGDLPAAGDYHGMFAHVHGTGKGYFAHSGSWIALANDTDKLNIYGGTMTGDVLYGDNIKAKFGAGSDLQIYHDSATNKSHITESGSSHLIIQGQEIQFKNAAGTSIMDLNSAQVELKFNGSKKMETETNGVTVTGNVTVTGTVDGRDIDTDGTKLDTIETNAKDDQTITAGAGLTGGGTGDVTLSHADTSSQVSSNNSGRTYIQDITLDTYGHITSLATATETVTNTNLTHTGEVTGSTSLTISDNVVDEANLKVSNAPTNGYFLSAQSGNTGGLTWATVPAGYSDSDVASYLSSNDYDTSTNIIAAITDSAPGTLDTLNELAAALGDDASFSTTVTNSIATKLPLAGGTITGDVNFNDFTELSFGASDDLRIYTEGTGAFIRTNSGDMKIRIATGNMLFQGADGSDTMAKFTHNGATELYYDNSKKIETTNTGVAVTGNVAVSGTVDGRNIDTDGTKLDTIATNANNYSHPNHTGEVTSTGDGATIITDNVVDAGNLKVTGNGTATQFLRSDGDGTFTWATPVDTDTVYTHPTHPGDDASIDTGALTGAVVISDLDFNVTTDTLGHVTDANATVATRTLTLANLGYTGETDATADQTAAQILTAIKTVDGSGTGLDADLLDGNHASAFATSAQGTKADNALPKAGGTMTGDLLAPGVNIGTTNTSYDLYNNGTSYLNGSATVDDNLLVTGNLTVQGIVTTTSAATLDVEDKTITLNFGSGDTTATADGAGIIIQDAVNSSTDASILWDASTDTFEISNKIAVTGDIDATRLTVTGASMLRRSVSSWTNAPLHDVLYNSWASGISDYVVLKSSGNSTSGHGALVVGDTGIYFGQTDSETAPSYPLDTTYGYVNSTAFYHGSDRVFDDGYHPNADILTTARNINGVAFDGSVNITIADSTKLPLAGGTMTGNLTVQNGSPRVLLTETGVTNTPTWWSIADGGNYNIRLNNTGVYPLDIVTNSTNDAVIHINVGYNTNFAAGIDVTGNITVSGTVDGRNVSTDGTKLDGIESGATADQTAAQLLTAIKTVDGSGSGLDADLLDGISSGSFLRNDASNTISTYTNRTTFYSNTNAAVTSSHQSSLEVYSQGAGNDAFMQFHVGGDYATYFGLDGDTNDLFVGGWSKGAQRYKMWHQGNDGSGSGLDADTVDGIQGSNFLRSDQEDSGIGLNLNGGSLNQANDATLYVTASNNNDWGMKIDANAASGKTEYGMTIDMPASFSYGLRVRKNGADHFRVDSAGAMIAGNYVWHAGNDGSGTGLDADLLDGQQGSYYQKKTTVQDAAPSGATGDLWYESDSGSFYVYYGGAWVDVAPGVETNTNLQINSLGVGTAASGTSGEIRATNDVTAYYSDERLKDFHGNIDSALDKVNQLNGYYFTENETAKELGYDNDKRQVGVSAQEVEAVLPEVVAEAPISDEYLTVKYEKLAPLFIEAIKEIDKKYQDKIDMLMEEIEKLKGN